MKKTLFLLAAALLMPAAGHAQLDNLLRKAADKTVNKVASRVVDRASERVANDVEKRLDKPAAEEKAPAQSLQGIMESLPELPSASDLVKYKDAQLNGKTLRLVSSKVTFFSARVLDLTQQAATWGLSDKDSAALAEAAYRYAESATGLTKEELEQLSQMSDEEQEAFLQAHYNSGRAQQVQAQTLTNIAQWMEPLQPAIEQWGSAGDEAMKAYDEMKQHLLPIYANYASRLADADDRGRIAILVAYYTEAVPYIRTAVSQALETRLKKQLPLAEEIEKGMEKLRKDHPEAAAQLPNYPKLTAAAYFSETARLLEIPEYSE